METEQHMVARGCGEHNTNGNSFDGNHENWMVPSDLQGEEAIKGQILKPALPDITAGNQLSSSQHVLSGKVILTIVKKHSLCPKPVHLSFDHQGFPWLQPLFIRL